MTDKKAVFLVHGSVARDFEQVAEFLTGDPHDQSKVQVYVDGHLYDVTTDVEKN